MQIANNSCCFNLFNQVPKHSTHTTTQSKSGAKAAPGLTSTDVNGLSKVLAADYTKFSADTTTMFENEPKESFGRKTIGTEGPAQHLGCDTLIQQELERLIETHGTPPSSNTEPTVLGRDLLESELLVIIFFLRRDGRDVT